MREKKERNRKLAEYARKHPDLTHAELSEIFDISRSRVTRILTRERKGEVANGESPFCIT